MDNKWVVIVIEQDNEGISVYGCQSEEDAQKRIREIWEHDIAVETEESTRRIDYSKSTCDNNYGELYYLGDDEPIRYSVEEVVPHQKNEVVSNMSIEINGTVYKTGDIIQKIVYKEKGFIGLKVSTEVKLVAINNRDGYIIISVPDVDLKQIFISEIQE